MFVLKKIEIIDKNKKFSKKRKFNLDAPRLTVSNGVLTFSEKDDEINRDMKSTEKVKVKVHDKKNNEIRIHKFKILLENQ